MGNTVQEDLELVGDLIEDLNDFMSRVSSQRLPAETPDRRLVLEAASLFMLFKGYEAAIDDDMSPEDITRLNDLITSFVIVESKGLIEEEKKRRTIN